MEAKAVCMAGKHSPEFYSPCPFQKFLKFLLGGGVGKREVDGENETRDGRMERGPIQSSTSHYQDPRFCAMAPENQVHL